MGVAEKGRHSGYDIDRALGGRRRKHGVRATRYTVQADADELSEISQLIDAGKVKPKVTRTFPLQSAAQALDAVEHGHSEGKIVLTVD